MKRSWLVLGAILLAAGCQTQSAHLASINGRFFLGGDKDCVRYGLVKPNTIVCGNAEGKITGYRNALTDQELYVYQSNRAIAAQQEAQQMAIMNANIAANNAAINAQTANTLQSVRRNAGFN